ncbi:MAG: glycosyl hydrolase [Nitrospinae bacterium]|nr:glycosyl hydrolase [Nitrospinota bacterium]
MASNLLQSLQWRCIGPYRGGRVVAVAGDPSDPAVFYFGACAGGVWKTTDGGTYWENISDGFFKTAAVGAIAVAEADPNAIYVGMGESCIRGDVSHGDGVYQSTDAGVTWVHLGLADSRHIARIRVHPKNPELVYVAALGHAYGPNQERGVYRSKDGGKTWEQVLFRSDKAGAIDLSLDPNNPRILYAAIWEAKRTPWSLTSGGPDSSLYKSSDGGDTWTELTNNPGLPRGLKGRIGVAASPAKPGRVWAIVEAEDGALFRSDDGGATWERLCEDRSLRLRFWYYGHVFADPQDPETVYVLNIQAWKSTDGGRTFTQLTTPHGDNHDLWIDPRNPRRMIEGNDGGACVSFNSGASWSTIYNQPTAQFYHVVADTQVPYRVYGTQQDNTAMSVPSRSPNGAILSRDCYPVGSSESGYIAVRPDDPNVVYSGAIVSAPGGGGVMLRYDHRTGQVRIITVWPEVYGGWGAKDVKYRFQWTYPIVLSPHDPHVLYATGNVVFRSTNDGTSWEAISPDLTRNDVTKMEPSGGPIAKDTTGAEHYGTIFAFVESPHARGVFWTGSDDGLIHISRKGGESWENVTPADLPEWTLISMIELSPHDPATAYVAATRYKLDDVHPYLYKTNDYGKTWQRITTGIPEHDFTRVVREDPARRGVLYAGTETGVYVSLDDGASWRSLQGNLPAVPIYDLIVKDHDLVAATHGRSFWILDDLTPLHQLTDQVRQAPAYLFTPRPIYRFAPPMGYSRVAGPGKNYQVAQGAPATYYETQTPEGAPVRTFLDAGQNPPDGVVVTYYLQQKPEGEVALSFLDAQGQVIKSFSSKAANEEPTATRSKEIRVRSEPGMNRFVWNMRYPDARGVPGDVTTERSLTGPAAPPGRYQVQLTVGGQTYAEPFEIRKDPRVSASQADLEAQFALLIRIRDKLSETHDAINRIRNLRQQVEEWVRRAEGQSETRSVADAATALTAKLSAIEEELIQGRARVQQDQLNLPTRLNAKLAGLTSVVASADAVPTQQAYDVFRDLSARINQQLGQLQDLIETDVAMVNNLIRQSGIPPIIAIS